MQVAQEYLGEVDERITRLATALPGGSALRGGTCGILLGAMVAIGLRYGSVDREGRDLCKALGIRTFDFFRELTRERFGSVDCRGISGFDFTDSEEARKYIGSEAQKWCGELLVNTVCFLLPLLDNRQQK
ncbi:MAG: C_GCAxxG_C_C family protein [Desulfobacteraceae bacterium]|nr:MAG: C_GCAxxG_C_C family protein [Desulfobacteraceae bacterium]